MRDSNTLLKEMLKTVDSHESSPVHLVRAIKTVMRNEVKDDTKLLVQTIFDWTLDFSKEGVSEEDQLLLDVNIDAIEGAQERKQILRRQRKALKRIRAKNKKHSSKVTPELVEICEATLTQTPEQAGDKLFFAALLVKEISIHDVVIFLKKVEPVQSAYGLDQNALELGALVKDISALMPKHSKGELWADFYIRNHTLLTKTKKKTLASLLKIHTEIKGKKCKFKAKRAFDAVETATNLASFATIMNAEFTKSEEAKLYEELDTSGNQQTVLLAANVSYVYKQKADYEKDLQWLFELLKKFKLNRANGEMTNLKQIIEKVEVMEYKVPEAGYFDNEVLYECSVKTVMNKKQLTANKIFMGNCTNGLHTDLKTGKGVLWIIVHQNHTYNAHAVKTGNGWRANEIKGRQNRENIPKPVNFVYEKLVEKLNS